MQLRFSKSDYSMFDQTDDYSYGTNTTYESTPRITVYIDGELVWGVEPT
jgi:hypothetical protein